MLVLLVMSVIMPQRITTFPMCGTAMMVCTFTIVAGVIRVSSLYYHPDPIFFKCR